MAAAGALIIVNRHMNPPYTNMLDNLKLYLNPAKSI